MLLTIIIATLVVSLISFVGLFTLSKRIKPYLHYLVSFAAGSLLAAAFFGLIPRALHDAGHEIALVAVLGGILLFFLVERYIHWHHCGHKDCDEKPAGVLILAGDFIHNFIDGVLLAGAFLLDFATGLVATISVIAHEIPQEIGDFSVLLHSGFSRLKALKLNFLSALSAVLGGIIGYFALDSVRGAIPYAVAIAAGGFIYISLTDIVPSLHQHKNHPRIKLIETLVFVLTIVVFFFLLGALHSH
ncbi:MAG: ZIP family metal transporter [Candidatus Woesearchaeota archaeon]